MRQANTTYVNLRSTLDELDPFVEASKPVAQASCGPTCRAAAVRARGGADRPRPEPVIRAHGRLERPDRAEPHLSGAGGHRAGRAPAEDRLRHRAGRSRQAPRRVPGAVGGAHRQRPDRRPRASRTRSTCSAGSTTSPTRAPTTRSAASRRVQTYFNAFTVVGGPPGPAAPAARARTTPSARSPGCGRSSAARAPPRSPPRTARTSGARRSRRSSTASRPTAPRGRSSETRCSQRSPSSPRSRRSACSRARSDPEGTLKTLRDRARQRVRPRRGRRPEDRRRQGRADDRLRPHRRPSRTA